MWFNPIITLLLRSPLYRLMGQGLMLITYKGRKSGKIYTTPINYSEINGELLTTSFKERKWWRNLKDGAQVTVHLNGRDCKATCVVLEDEEDVKPALAEFLRLNPGLARALKVGKDEDGQPAPEDVRRAARGRVMIKTKII